jgi:hypothetical protein
MNFDLIICAYVEQTQLYRKVNHILKTDGQLLSKLQRERDFAIGGGAIPCYNAPFGGSMGRLNMQTNYIN